MAAIDMQHIEGDLWQSEMVVSGIDRLRLLYHGSEEDGWYFDSVVWDRFEGGRWVSLHQISKADFNELRLKERWVSGIHSFDPATGTAVLQIAEYEQPQSDGTMGVLYTWRYWNMLSNSEGHVLQVCKSPFDAYIG